MPDPLRILFVCTGNLARSQMAEGLARHLGQGRVEALGAGMEPSHLNPWEEGAAGCRTKSSSMAPIPDPSAVRLGQPMATELFT
jgi:protein-tyrosine-phosphatase